MYLRILISLEPSNTLQIKKSWPSTLETMECRDQFPHEMMWAIISTWTKSQERYNTEPSVRSSANCTIVISRMSMLYNRFSLWLAESQEKQLSNYLFITKLINWFLPEFQNPSSLCQSFHDHPQQNGGSALQIYILYTDSFKTTNFAGAMPTFFSNKKVMTILIPSQLFMQFTGKKGVQYLKT